MQIASVDTKAGVAICDALSKTTSSKLFSGSASRFRLMFSTSTVITYTGISPRWVAYLGFVLALLLLFGSSYLSWVFVAFPFWVFLISICLLTDEFRRRVRASSTKA